VKKRKKRKKKRKRRGKKRGGKKGEKQRKVNQARVATRLERRKKIAILFFLFFPFLFLFSLFFFSSNLNQAREAPQQARGTSRGTKMRFSFRTVHIGTSLQFVFAITLHEALSAYFDIVFAASTAACRIVGRRFDSARRYFDAARHIYALSHSSRT